MKTTVQPITVGVADEQRAALSFAAHEARWSDCDLQVVHAYTVPPAPPKAVAASWGVDVGTTFRESGRAVLADALAALTAQHVDIVVHPVLERGGASRVLTTLSKTSRLVVLGPDDGAPWYTRLFESRVSRKLAFAADCPVVVVPDSWGRGPRARGVTLLLDGMTLAHGPLHFAFEHAARHDDALHIVNLVSDGTDENGRVPWDDMLRLIESWNARYPDVVTDVHVVDGVADEQTVKPFEATGLLVLGRPPGTGVLASHHGSLARSVIEHADCPVAVVPLDYDG